MGNNNYLMNVLKKNNYLINKNENKKKRKIHAIEWLRSERSTPLIKFWMQKQEEEKIQM
jgi:hypothetical protein